MPQPELLKLPRKPLRFHKPRSLNFLQNSLRLWPVRSQMLLSKYFLKENKLPSKKLLNTKRRLIDKRNQVQRTSLRLEPPPRRHRRELLLLRSRSRWREIRRELP